MTQENGEDHIQQALRSCAEEPVHIPGAIQPFGWLLAYHQTTHEILYASDNASEALHKPIAQILGQDAPELLGSDIWHALQNIVVAADIVHRRLIVGSWNAAGDGKSYLVAAWASDDCIVLEFEEEIAAPVLSAQRLQEQSMLINKVQAAKDIDSLLNLTTRQLRALTGFDRVMVYRFDQDWNGEVIAESNASGIEPYLGLHFPSFDIPAQARAIMAKIPLRLIADIDASGLPISAARPDLPALDLSLGELRATSPVHVQYLRNMGSHATMTLSVVLDGVLWGIISFHHRQPRIVPAQVRMALSNFLEVFQLKLGLLVESSIRQLSQSIDDLLQELHSVINRDPSFGDLLKALGASLGCTFQACGFFIQSDRDKYSVGEVPSPSAIDALIEALPEDENEPYFSDSLSTALPTEFGGGGGVAGVAAVRHAKDWTLLIFRSETTQTVSWAGNPHKTIEFVDGNARLSPRGSFSTFLAEQQGKSRPWTAEDRMLAKKLWPLLSFALSSEEKRRYMSDLNRQQELMIDELNHRVRNILALIQSISSEAKTSQSSLESYSSAIEARIRALAAAHSIRSGSTSKRIGVADIIALEAKPYESEPSTRVQITGVRKAIASEFAPILALTIHELMTNAAKYGALSNSAGKVAVVLRQIGQDLEISWTETGGPPVVPPNRMGFGSTLVKRAVPYELGGTSSHVFARDGVRARVTLPAAIISDAEPDADLTYEQPDFDSSDFSRPHIPAHLIEGVVLVLEDNFMIAEGTTQQLKSLGFQYVETVSNIEAARAFLEEELPSFAVLDINLGQGKTSLPFAEFLQERRVPLVFVTGYGELASMPAQLAKKIVLTKPIETLELAYAIARSDV